MAYSDKVILITGGAGFIGSAVIEQLLKTDVSQIYAVDNLVRGRKENLKSAFLDDRIEFIEGDICDRPLMERLLSEADILIHLAALRIRHCIAEPEIAFQIMFQAPFDLFCLAAKSAIERVVSASSSSIYGQADWYPTGERHHPYNDETFYGAGKLFNEGMLRVLANTHGLNFIALRPFNVYGPRMDIHGAYTEVMVRWMERIASGKNPIIYGDGKQSMDFTYVDDVARAFVIAASNSAPLAGAFNVGTGISTSLGELARVVTCAMGSALPVEYQAATNVASVERRQADINLARDILGFEAHIGLEEGVNKLVKWWRTETGY